MPINPSLKLDLQKDFNNKLFHTSLIQKVIYYRQNGLQEISQAIFNRKINDKIQTDMINSIVWSDETDLIVLRNNFVLYQKLSDENSLSYSVGANAKFSPTFNYDSYDASISLRQLLYKNWLYGTFTTGFDFPKANHFKDEKFVQLRLDIFFKE